MPWRHLLFTAAAGGFKRRLFPYGRIVGEWQTKVLPESGQSYGELWKYIQVLASDREHAYVAEAETDAASFLWLGLFAVGVSIAVAIDSLLNRDMGWWPALLPLVGVAIFGVMYLQAMAAVRRSGAHVKVSVELHHEDVLDRISRLRGTDG